MKVSEKKKMNDLIMIECLNNLFTVTFDFKIIAAIKEFPIF